MLRSGNGGFSIIKAQLCYEFKWSEEQFNNTSLDFIFKCIIYLEEVQRAMEKANKKPKK